MLNYDVDNIPEDDPPKAPGETTLPVLSGPILPAPPDEAEKAFDIIQVCGDFGGMASRTYNHTVEGFDEEVKETVTEPCDLPSSFGISGARPGITPGRCFRHTAAALEGRERSKAEFLEYYSEHPKAGIEGTALALGLKLSTIQHWRMRDTWFRAAFDDVKEFVEDLRVEGAERSMYERIEDPSKNCDALRVWWLQNRAKGRWQNPKSPDFQPGGGASFKGGKHVHLWQVGPGRQIDWPEK
jgi:hypothetical protein